MIKWVNLVTYIVMVSSNIVANVGKLGGNTTAGVSALYDSVLTPAGYTFIIWGLIYALLLYFVIAPFVNSEGRTAAIAEKTGIMFSLSCILNTFWIILWHNKSIVLSFLIMLALLACLYVILQRQMLEKNRVTTVKEKPLQRFLSTAGMELYFGWICVAMLANMMSMFTALGMDGFGTWARIIGMALLIFGAAMIGLISMYSSNTIIAIGALWAFGGILFRHISVTMLNRSYTGIVIAAITGNVLIITGLILGLVVYPVKQPA